MPGTLLQRASTGIGNRGDSPQPATMEKESKHRLSFFQKLKPGHKKDKSADDSQISSASSSSINGQDPPRSTPIKRSTDPPRSSQEPFQVTRKPLPVAAQTQNVEGSAAGSNRPTIARNATTSAQQKSALRRDDSSSDAAQDSGVSGMSNVERIATNGSVQTAVTSASRAGSTARIRFAEEPDIDIDGTVRPRARRNSSTGTRGRRSSIYHRETEGGDYAEGVDAGVGSKARRLSVQIPDQLFVDECRLEEHFNALARLNKKKI